MPRGTSNCSVETHVILSDLLGPPPEWLSPENLWGIYYLLLLAFEAMCSKQAFHAVVITCEICHLVPP